MLKRIFVPNRHTKEKRRASLSHNSECKLITLVPTGSLQVDNYEAHETILTNHKM
jgi:hypothetical protein